MTEMVQQPLVGRSILVVEDEYVIATELAQSLEDLGAVVVGPAGSVGDALTLVSEGAPIDAALLDVNLGSERVYPVADILQAQGVPYIFTTGYEGWTIPAPYSAAPWCEKPINIGHLVRILSSFQVASKSAEL
jgi:CheY-like chemotaxis protein